jgi:hypothetical protein
LWANASENLELRADIRKGFLGIGRHVEVTASCRKHNIPIPDPIIGCPKCAEERPGFAIVGEDK